MPKWNLDALGADEFERLCQALVKKVIASGAKVYGMGKDGARDATYKGKAEYPSIAEQWAGSWIIQVKFHDVQQIGPKQARRMLLKDLRDELLKITEKYKHPCDNYILMTNVSLTPAFQKGTKDTIDRQILPRFQAKIKHIEVWGAEEICRFLDDYTNVRSTYSHLLASGDIIAALMKLLKLEKKNSAELIKLYCQACYDHEKYAALDDAGDVEDERVALQRLFVDLDVKPSSVPQDPELLEGLPRWIREAAEDEDRTSALSYLLDDTVRGLVLVGGPGSGKSTLGQYLAQIHRARLLEVLDELCDGENSIGDYENCTARIPFRVLLREYAQWVSRRQDTGSLFSYLAFQVSEESQRETKAEDIQAVVSTNPVVLILDGLDEVAEKRLRRRVIDNIASFVNQTRSVLSGDLRVVGTTRPYGYSAEFEPARYLHLTLQNLEAHRAAYYATRWAKVREHNPKNAQMVLSAFEKCSDDPVVSVLTQTPLQVTILLVIIRAKGSPPKQREELFKRYMDVIYEREQKKRPELLRTESTMIYGLHEYLAYILHRRAEKDMTAALMPIEEFRQRVAEYVLHANPLLDEKELDAKVSQVIAEAEQRLVLIESPQEGQVGFGLTTTREFFTAAHLVDTAKDSAERDARFKAIARSPHWRNVALFFSGRMGRRLPGEVSSMIDVCREIDTEGPDTYLRRGGRLVIEMIDDRALREPHHEIGALEYALETCDSEFVFDWEDFLSKLSSLSPEYKERIIRPWLERRLGSAATEKLELYGMAYAQLFGPQAPLEKALEKASKSKHRDTKMWALTQALGSNIVKPWVAQTFQELADRLPEPAVAWSVGESLTALRQLCAYELSDKARAVLAQAIATATLARYGGRGKTPRISVPPSSSNENELFMWAVVRLIELSNSLIPREDGTRPPDHSISLPHVANPALRRWRNKYADPIDRFCETFGKRKGPLDGPLVAVFRFLQDPKDVDALVGIWRYIQSEAVERHVKGFLRNVLYPLLNTSGLPDDEEDVRQLHGYIAGLVDRYTAEADFREDSEELSRLTGMRSHKTDQHALMLSHWIDGGCLPDVEPLLDAQIIEQLRSWLNARGLAMQMLPVCHSHGGFLSRDTLLFCGLAIEIIRCQLARGRKRLTVPWTIILHEWHDPQEMDEAPVAESLTKIWESVLKEYGGLIDPDHTGLEQLYCSALGAGIIQQHHLDAVYDVVKNDGGFGRRLWIEGDGNVERALSTAREMLKSGRLPLERLGAISVAGVHAQPRREPSRVPAEECWVGQKLWELAQDESDNWQTRHLKAMAFCRLSWAAEGVTWLKAIAEANSEETLNAWCAVIEHGDCETTRDTKALYDALLQILESPEVFCKAIRQAALRRLHRIIQDVETLDLDEAALNLPMPSR